MTQQHGPAPIQEPGIGGTVDLEGIQRFRKVRIAVYLLLSAVTIAIAFFSAEGWLGWPDDFALRRRLPVGLLTVYGYICATIALNISAGNRTENRLVFLAAALAAGLGMLVAAGCAALLFIVDPVSISGWRVALPLLIGFVAILPVTAPAAILASRRHKRLVQAASDAMESGHGQETQP